ncbi:UNVERIFIED_ORG: hypothetical protein J2806_003125 [Kosakonia oryzae]|nr:hypothetical protein [Kosakonia oryzae]
MAVMTCNWPAMRDLLRNITDKGVHIMRKNSKVRQM